MGNAPEFDEVLKDAELGIKTLGRDDKHSDTFRYPYEPTTYSVLDRLLESEYILKEDYVIDYGSGLGRVPIYLNYKLGCRTCGVEMMDAFVEKAQENLESYLNTCKAKTKAMISAAAVTFEGAQAELWTVPVEATAFFFFNPFSDKILRGVMNRILDSYYENPREMRLFFYYPQDEYIAFMMNVDEAEFEDEIDCTDLFGEMDQRNRIMIFAISPKEEVW